MGINKIGVPGFGSIFASAGVAHSIDAADSYVIPVGWYYIATGADVTLELQTSAATWTALYYTAGSALLGPYYSDGTNLRATNGGGGAEDVTLYAL